LICDWLEKERCHRQRNCSLPNAENPKGMSVGCVIDKHADQTHLFGVLPRAQHFDSMSARYTKLPSAGQIQMRIRNQNIPSKIRIDNLEVITYGINVSIISTISQHPSTASGFKHKHCARSCCARNLCLDVDIWGKIEKCEGFGLFCAGVCVLLNISKNKSG